MAEHLSKERELWLKSTARISECHSASRENDAGLPRVTRVTRKCQVFENSISNTSIRVDVDVFIGIIIGRGTDNRKVIS